MRRRILSIRGRKDYGSGSHLQELHEPELQVEHPDDVCFWTPLMPKVENFFTTSTDVHPGHDTLVFPKTSFSNSSPQEGHLYSNIGMSILRLVEIYDGPKSV